MFSLKKRDDREQNVQQFLDQLSVALIEFALFDAIDEPLDLGRISGGGVIVVFHRRRSRRSYAKRKRTPRPERKYFLFSRGLTAGTRSICFLLFLFVFFVSSWFAPIFPARFSIFLSLIFVLSSETKNAQRRRLDPRSCRYHILIKREK